MRICLVTPFAWSQPHDVNEHVDGVARALRSRGHEVTVLAPSTRAGDLLAGRRALVRGERRDVLAVGPAVPVSRRSQLGVPVGVRANLALAVAQGDFDVVHGFEPALPSLSYLALRDVHALAVATFASPDRLGYPPGRAQRERLLARIDALVALSERGTGRGRGALPGRVPPRLAGRRRRALQPAGEAARDRGRAAPERARGGARRAAGAPRRSRSGRSCCCGRSR